MKNNNRVKTISKNKLLDNVIYLVLLGLIIVTIVINPKFLSFTNLKNILAQSSVSLIVALGMGMVLIARGVDLSAGRMVGLIAIVSATLLQQTGYSIKIYKDLPELPLTLVFVLMIILGGLFGSLSGTFVAKFNVPPIITTLSMQLIIYGIASLYYDRPPYGAQPIGGISKNLVKLSTGSIKIGSIEIPYLIIIAAFVSFVAWILWNKTVFGQNMYAVGGNPEAAYVSGVNVFKTQIMIYAIAAMFYAFAGVLEVGRIGSASTNTGNAYEMDAIAACVVGGVSMSGGIGTVSGIVVGVLIFTVINYGLAFIGVNMYWQYIVKGLIILLAVILDMRSSKQKK